MDDIENIKAAFTLVCKKCGSEYVVIDVESGADDGGDTGYSPGHLSIGCNACKQNDLTVWM